ncbi:MAG: serine/threonine protein kinase [Bacillota bacterium]
MLGIIQPIDYLHLPQGTNLNEQYVIIDKLFSASNLSIIYLAINQTTKEKVVIKEFFPRELVLRDLDAKLVISKNHAQKELLKQELESFLEEGRIMKELQGAGIGTCYDFFEENNTAYLVLEYYQGQTLESYLEEHTLSLEQFLNQIFYPLLTAVNKVHQQGYIHRDLKPANIIYNDGITLIDFGSAIKWQENKPQKKVLTPGYSPLEFYSTTAKQSPSSDIYSLAAILYKFLTNQVPKMANKRIIEDSLVSVVGFNLGVSKGLNNFIMKNLDLDAKHRCQNIRKFRLNLEFEYLKIRSKKILKIFLNKLFKRG